MPKTLTTTVLVASGTTIAAGGAAVRAAIDVRNAGGGTIHMRITNASTALTAECVGRIFHAPTTGATPALAGAGADWKQQARFGGTALASRDSNFNWNFGPERSHLEVEFFGNAGQAVTVEATITTFPFD